MHGSADVREHGRALVIFATLCTLVVLGLAPSVTATPARRPPPPATSGPAWLARQAAARGIPQVVLAQDHGLLLTGRLSALRGNAAPALEDLGETHADALGSLPERNVFLRGAVCDWGGRTSRFGAPVTLTFTLPKALFRETPLPLYRYDGHAWKRLTGRALVGEVNTTASATITRPGRYALLLTTEWKTITEDGEVLVEYADDTSPTVILDPELEASGTTDDPAVIAATMAATSSTEEQAVATLRSFDSASTLVQVLTLTRPSAMQRYWSSSTVGRWFTPSGPRELLSPTAACRVYALPASNTGENVTLHLVKRGAVLISGVCADMTDQSGYGPWATGGGDQYFGPQVSTYPPPAYDPAVTVVLADLRWEKAAVDAIEW